MFKFKFSFSSFRLCRPKNSKTTHFYSPFNPKALEITYPTTPSPPPTTPSHRPRISKSKTAPLTTTPEMLNSPVGRNTVKKMRNKEMNNMDSSDESGWFSNIDRETESFTDSFDSSIKDDFLGGTKMVSYVGGGTKKKMKNVKESWKSKAMKESLAVVKWSEKPYDDFKRSMLEMIMEKEMFEVKDLEQLLQCFLTLNSKHHHADIVAAFTEIWELLFRACSNE